MLDTHSLLVVEICAAALWSPAGGGSDSAEKQPSTCMVRSRHPRPLPIDYSPAPVVTFSSQDIIKLHVLIHIIITYLWHKLPFKYAHLIKMGFCFTRGSFTFYCTF